MKDPLYREPNLFRTDDRTSLPVVGLAVALLAAAVGSFALGRFVVSRWLVQRQPESPQIVPSSPNPSREASLPEVTAQAPPLQPRVQVIPQGDERSGSRVASMEEAASPPSGNEGEDTQASKSASPTQDQSTPEPVADRSGVRHETPLTVAPVAALARPQRSARQEERASKSEGEAASLPSARLRPEREPAAERTTPSSAPKAAAPLPKPTPAPAGRPVAPPPLKPTPPGRTEAASAPKPTVTPPARSATPPAATPTSSPPTRPASASSPQSSPPAPSPRFRVQAGAFSQRDGADSVAEQLRSKGFEVYVRPVGQRYVVQLGVFTQRERAQKVMDQVRSAGFEATTVQD